MLQTDEGTKAKGELCNSSKGTHYILSDWNLNQTAKLSDAKSYANFL